MTTGLALCIAAAAVAVASAAPEAGTKYSGNTSQGFRASFWTTEAANGLRSFRIRRRFRCGQQTVVGTFRLSEGGMAIREDGRYYGQAKVEPGGEINRGVFTIRGRFGPRGKAARGTYRERVRVDSGARCDTGTVRYRVAAER